MRRSPTKWLTVPVLALAITIGAVPVSRALAQVRGRGGGGGSSATAQALSATVYASLVSTQSYTYNTSLTLLVLWRGTPGWMSKGGGNGGSGGGSGGTTAWRSFTQGGLSFGYEIDHERSLVKILDQEISLKANNVVFVDFMDSPTGPTVVGSRLVDLPPNDQAPLGAWMEDIIRRSPELFEYLQCDLTASDPVLNSVVAFFCARMRP